MQDDNVREAIRLVLAVVMGSSIGIEKPGNALIDSFTPEGHIMVNGRTINTVDAINAGARLASHLLSEHAGDPMEALRGDLLTLTRWEAEHE